MNFAMKVSVGALTFFLAHIDLAAAQSKPTPDQPTERAEHGAIQWVLVPYFERDYRERDRVATKGWIPKKSAEAGGKRAPLCAKEVDVGSVAVCWTHRDYSTPLGQLEVNEMAGPNPGKQWCVYKTKDVKFPETDPNGDAKGAVYVCSKVDR